MIASYDVTRVLAYPLLLKDKTTLVLNSMWAKFGDSKKRDDIGNPGNIINNKRECLRIS